MRWNHYRIVNELTALNKFHHLRLIHSLDFTENGISVIHRK